MRIHFIAIGGAIMHNLAMVLHKKGDIVTGSDDEIFDPSKSRLKKYGLLPEKWGWDANKITSNLDAVIVGMHAKEDNPELRKALDLGIKIYSFPAFMYEQTRDKKRIVIAGSHGKTTITSMILHVLKSAGKKFDYLVGSQIEGFEMMAGLSDKAEMAIFEGDEYLTSPLDKVPKFFHYKPHISVLSGIAWDHFNVFPTFENYLSQFKILIEWTEPDGILFYDDEDDNIKLLNLDMEKRLQCIPYSTVTYENSPYSTVVETENKSYFLKVFGRHNMKNINAARLVCRELGIDEDTFYESMQNFTGAKRRLEILKEDDQCIVFSDFAHAPSKVKATLSALKEKYNNRRIIALFELHTFSSLNKNFLPQYAHSMDDADEATVYFNQEVIEHKNLEDITVSDIRNAFQNKDINVINDKQEFINTIQSIKKDNAVIVFMSSGNFFGLNIQSLVNNL